MDHNPPDSIPRIFFTSRATHLPVLGQRVREHQLSRFAEAAFGQILQQTRPRLREQRPGIVVVVPMLLLLLRLSLLPHGRGRLRQLLLQDGRRQHQAAAPMVVVLWIRAAAAAAARQRRLIIAAHSRIFGIGQAAGPSGARREHLREGRRARRGGSGYCCCCLLPDDGVALPLGQGREAVEALGARARASHNKGGLLRLVVVVIARMVLGGGRRRRDAP